MYQAHSRNRIGLYEKALPNAMPWEEKFITAKELEFDFLEISIDESEERRARLDSTGKEIYALRRLCEQHQMPLHSLCLSAHRKFPFGSVDPKIRRQAEIHMQKGISFAYKLGIRVIQLAGYDVYYEPADEATHQRFVEGMKFCAKIAEHAGIMLAVEIMDTNYLNSLSKFEILKREIPSPYFMAYPDVGNISGWNYDTSTELSLSRDHIVQIHLKDTLKVTTNYPGKFRDLVIGEGEVDFIEIFNTLKKIDYTAPLVIEMWANDLHWRENIIAAQQHLHRTSSAAGISIFPDTRRS